MPLPSSPHCAPTTTVAGTVRSLPERKQAAGRVPLGRPFDQCSRASSRPTRRTTMRWPRRHVVKPTSASRRSVPSITVESTEIDQAYLSAQPDRRARHASQATSKLVASGPTQTCWRSTVTVRPREPHASWSCRASGRPRARADGRSGGRRPRGRSGSGRRRRRRRAQGCREPTRAARRRGSASPARGSRRGSARRGTRTGSRPARSRPCFPRHAAALASCLGARSENLAKRLRNASFSVPIGPLRCFARITSARPWSSDWSL